MIIVSDTSCLCYLALLKREHWLHELYGEIFIPPAVATELANGAASQPDIQRVLACHWLVVRTLNDETAVLKFLEKVDLGEAQAVALYQQLQADLLMVDDLDGRMLAQQLGVRQIRLLGFLLAAKKAGLMKNSLKTEFESLLALGFRASALLIETILKEVGE